MFRRIEGQAERPVVTLYFEGRAIQALEGETLAVALLSAGVESFRQTPVSGSPRAPMCLMGVCFDCLVQIDGVGNVQACTTLVRESMRITRQDGSRTVGGDS